MQDEEDQQPEPQPRSGCSPVSKLTPNPDIRQAVAWYLLPRAHEDLIGQALRAASADDEDVEVRWIARYALRLAASAHIAGPTSSS